MIWRSKLIRDVAVGLFTTLALFAGVEVALRAALTPLAYRILKQNLYSSAATQIVSPLFFRLDPELLWTFDFNLDERFHAPHEEVHFQTNGFAQRIELPRGSYPAANRPLLVSFGDSCTAAMEADTSYGKAVAELIVRNDPGLNVEVVNAGTNGYSSEQGLRTVKRLLGKGARPRWALVHFGHNDASFAMAGIPDRQLNLEIVSTFRLRRWLAESYTVVWLYGRLIDFFPKALPEGAGLNARVPPGEYLDNLREMVKRLKAAGAQVVLVNSATAGHARDYLNDYNAAMKEVARAENIAYIDVQRTAEKYGDDLFFNDPAHDIVHPSPRGHEWIAEDIFTALKR